MDPLLTPPALPDHQLARGSFELRYDDLDLHGRLQCLSAAHALGAAVWRPLLAKHPVARWCNENVVLPVLARLIVERCDGPLAVRNPLTCDGALELAHVAGGEPGSVDRILLLMWTTLSGVVGTTNPPRPANSGTAITAAKVYAEHVLTAALAPPGQRKVRRLGGEGVEPVPPRVYEAPPIADYAALPAGATALGEPIDDAPFLFGLMHTDANLHVNSLVYPRLFEEAALRRLAALGETGPKLARSISIGYRKPFFAEDRMRLRLQAFRVGEQLGVGGALFPVDRDGTMAPKASTYARIVF